MDRTLKGLAEAVGEHPALRWLADRSRTIGGFSREDYFAYESLFGALPGISPSVRLEPGVQSGAFPTEVIPIRSLVGQYLAEEHYERIADDVAAFDMTLLHFRRTFVEKLFAIHGKVLRLQADGHPLGRDARHYSDLFVLAGDPEVHTMLTSPEYRAIRRDYDINSRRFFATTYRPPDHLSFAASAALFPDRDLRAQIARDYDAQCALLFPTGDFPSFPDVLGRFEEVRHLL